MVRFGPGPCGLRVTRGHRWWCGTESNSFILKKDLFFIFCAFFLIVTILQTLYFIHYFLLLFVLHGSVVDPSEWRARIKLGG